MTKIQVLPKHVADLIAAGEVVERPASVVKELCENALDAGATALTVEIQAGGIKLIRVTDNGHGIAPDDIRMAFQTHATSKIKSADDLENILSLGFRGEALASVAAVARVQMLTRMQGDELGACYKIEAGEEILLEEAGCPAGTTIIVRDLFYKTPARAKFLKKDVTEGNYVGAALERISLSCPSVAVTFIRDGKQVFSTPGDGSAASAVRAVLGKAFYEQTLGVKNTYEGIEVTGFVSLPVAARPNRNMQYFFLNGRYIKSPTMTAALAQAYKNAIPAGKFSACVLYVTLPPGLVDVNVHPHKTEVRFADERPVFSAVYQAALVAINTQNTMPNISLEQVKPAYVPPQRSTQASSPVYAPPPVRAQQITLNDSCAQESAPAFKSETPSLLRRERSSSLPTQAPVQTPKQSTVNSQISTEIVNCTELFQTYFLVEVGEELLLIDKHAAHERIIYEQLKAQTGQVQRQVLLAPLPLSLSRQEVAALLQHSDLLLEAGFLIESFGEDAAVMRECPMLLCGHDLNAQAAEIAGYLLERRQDITTHALDWIFHSAACRAAVKAGDPTTQYEREQFVQKLLAMPNIRHCPHGRPVIVTITKKELEKRFLR